MSERVSHSFKSHFLGCSINYLTIDYVISFKPPHPIHLFNKLKMTMMKKKYPAARPINRTLQIWELWMKKVYDWSSSHRIFQMFTHFISSMKKEEWVREIYVNSWYFFFQKVILRMKILILSCWSTFVALLFLFWAADEREADEKEAVSKWSTIEPFKSHII